MREQSTPPPRHARADLVLIVITAFWGGTFVLIKDALTHIDPFPFLALRFLVGAVAATAIANVRLKDGHSVRSGLKLAGLLFLGYGLQTWGLAYTTPSRSAFITGMCVVLVPFVSIVVFRRAPRIYSVIGVTLAAFGLYQLTLGADVLPTAPPRQGFGDLLTFLCAVAYAFHITLNERYAPKAKVTAMVATQLWVVALLAAVLLPIVPHHLALNGQVLFAVGLTGIFGSAVAILLQTWAQARTTAVRAGLIFSLEPVFTAVYSVLLGREALGWPEVIGGGLIVSGVLVGELGPPVADYLRAR